MTCFLAATGRHWHGLHLGQLRDVRSLAGRSRTQQLDTAQKVTIRHRETSICETVPGVKSYSGYVDTGDGSHTFFWLFRARVNPETAPITLWLNGGPGSDSMVGLFQGDFPCFL